MKGKKAAGRRVAPSYFGAGVVIWPRSVGRVSGCGGMFSVTLFMKVIFTLSPSNRHVTVSWCGVS